MDRSIVTKLPYGHSSGNISGFSGPDFSINAAMVQFNTSGEVNIDDGWPAVLKPSTGGPVQFIDDSDYVTVP